MSISNCLSDVVHFWTFGLPAQLAPHAIYFVKDGSNITTYVTDANGVPYVVGGGGGGTITLTSPNGTISINGYELEISAEILESIISLHNNFPDLQGGLENEYYHLSKAQHDYLINVADNDLIGDIQDALNNLAVPPTYVAPTSSITNVTATYEVGSSQSINITQTYVQNDGGGVTAHRITKNASTVSNLSTFSESLTVPLGSTTYAGNVDYAQGACKENNIGIIDCTGRIEAGSTTSPTRTVTGIYPVFYLKSSSPITAASMQSAINAGTASKLVVSSTGTISVPYAPNGEYVAVAYPTTSTTKTKWFVSILDSGDIPGGVFGAQSTLSVNSPTGLWSAINYKIHVTPLLTNPSAPTIELRNS